MINKFSSQGKNLFSMNRKEPHFKRIVSQNSPPTGNSSCPVTQKPQDYPSTRRLTKPKEPSSGLENWKQSSNYWSHPDHEPLLSHGLSTSASDLLESDSSSHHVASSYNIRNIIPPDLCANSHGIRSVTDINLTMGDDVGQCINYVPSCLGGESNSIYSLSNKSTSSPLVRCSKISCDENTCLWLRCVLKLPQHVRWEDRIVAVELDKTGSESFGFNYKSKRHFGRDEIYTLVSRVDAASKAASSGLLPGDLILSVNNIPMQTKQKLTEVNLRSQNKLRLLIQHPCEISSKAAAHVEELRLSMLAACEGESEVSGKSFILPQPPTPSTSPPEVGLSPSQENIPLSNMPKQETPITMQYHQLPKVRVFVVGNATTEFIQSLIGDCVHVLSQDRPRCFEISLKMSADHSISVGNSESFSYLFEDTSESCINVELISVPDDRFFHHCCSWMFTSNALFILTFDTKRLAQSSESEMSHLCSLTHTVQTGVAGPCNLRLYGLTPPDDNIRAEEVHTLFYTSLGKSLPEPKVMPLAKGAFSDEMNQIRLDIFSVLLRICQQQQVVYPTAVALDMLVSHRGLTTSVNQIAKTLEDWNTNCQPLKPDTLRRVVEDLKNSGNLLVSGSLNTSCTSDNLKEFVLPCILFEHLSFLAQCTEKEKVPIRHQDTWVTLYTCGILSRTEFLDILSVCTPNPHRLLGCMQDVHLVYPIHMRNQDSGFVDGDNILFPYFLQDGQPNPVDDCQLHIMFEFSVDVSAKCFYSVLSELSHSDQCLSFSMRTQSVADLILCQEQLTLHFQKMAKQLMVYKHRHSAEATSSRVQSSSLLLIQQVLTRHIPTSVKIKVNLYSIQDPNMDQPVPALPIAVPDEGDLGLEMQRVLDTNIDQLRSIFPALQEIYRYLSSPEIFQVLPGYCDLTLAESRLYESIITRSSLLPAKAFFDLYFQENRVTLRRFMEILLRLVEEEQHFLLDELVRRLWQDALQGNR